MKQKILDTQGTRCSRHWHNDSIESIRQQWRGLARQYDAKWSVIKCIWSDEVASRKHLLNHQCNILGWSELDWSGVECVKIYYAIWDEEQLVLDVINSLDENIVLALQYINTYLNSSEVKK